MSEFMDKVNDTISSIPDLIVGVIYLAIALLLAFIAYVVVTKLLGKSKLGKKLDSYRTVDENGQSSSGQAIKIIGKLVFLIIFLLFLPAVLEKFGMKSVTAPITNLVNSFFGYIPNVVACIAILVVGFFIASIVRQLIIAAIGVAKIQKLQDKISGGKGSFNLAKIVGTVVYVFILIPVMIAALSTLGIAAISDPATNMLNSVISAVPSIIVALVLVFLGVFLAQMVASFLSSILESTNMDNKINNWLASDSKKDLKPIKLSKIITAVVKAIIIVLFSVEAISTLEFDILTNVGTAIIGFLPSALIAIIFALLAYILCRVIDTKTNFKSATLTTIVKVVIITVSAFIALSQLSIAPYIVNNAFIILMASAGGAFILAAGLGGRQFVADLLANVKIKKNADKTDKSDK